MKCEHCGTERRTEIDAMGERHEIRHDCVAVLKARAERAEAEARQNGSDVDAITKSYLAAQAELDAMTVRIIGLGMLLNTARAEVERLRSTLESISRYDCDECEGEPKDGES